MPRIPRRSEGDEDAPPEDPRRATSQDLGRTLLAEEKDVVSGIEAGLGQPVVARQEVR